MVRLWNLEHDENYVLTLADADMSGKLLTDRVMTAEFAANKRILVGGTAEGRIVM